MTILHTITTKNGETFKLVDFEEDELFVYGRRGGHKFQIRKSEITSDETKKLSY